MVLIILESYLLDTAGGTWVSKARTESPKGENSWIQRGRWFCKIVQLQCIFFVSVGTFFRHLTIQYKFSLRKCGRRGSP